MSHARLVIALSLSAVAVAAPVPKAKTPPYPFDVGTKWEYVVREGDTSSDEVTRSEEKDGIRTVRMTTTPPVGRKRVTDFEFKDGELRLVAHSDVARLKGTIIVWKADMREGDTWANEYQAGGGETFNEVVSVGKAEEVKTPAGKFQAVPVKHTFKMPKEQPGYTDWYADGVGLIRQTVDDQKEPAQELKAFTPGKK